MVVTSNTMYNIYTYTMVAAVVVGGVGQLQYVVEVLYVHTCGIVYVIHGHITAKLKESSVTVMLSNGINIIHMHILSTQEVPCAYRYIDIYACIYTTG